MTHWMIVTSPDNYTKTRALGFTVQGVKTRHRRKTERMAPGDRLCWYVTKLQRFVATATITSPAFEGRERIWVSESTGDPYPWRFAIEKSHAVNPAEGVIAESLVSDLSFVKKWPAPHWRLAFQGNLHEVPEADFAVIERAVVGAERTNPRASIMNG